MPAIVSHKYKFVFPHIPRTGGTSLTELMKPHLGPHDISDELLEKHQSLRDMQRGFRRKGVFENYVKFAVVRHPFDRLASLHQGYKPRCTLGEIVEQLASGKININKYAFFWPMQRWVCDINGKSLVDKVCKLEAGLKPVVQFLNKRGMPVKIDDLPHINRGEVNDGNTDYYAELRGSCSPETIRTIERLYAWDYKAFGYE